MGALPLVSGSGRHQYDALQLYFGRHSISLAFCEQFITDAASNNGTTHALLEAGKARAVAALVAAGSASPADILAPYCLSPCLVPQLYLARQDSLGSGQTAWDPAGGDPAQALSALELQSLAQSASAAGGIPQGWVLLARSIWHVHDCLHVLTNGEKQFLKVHKGLLCCAPGVQDRSFHYFVMSVGRLLTREKNLQPMLKAAAAALGLPPPPQVAGEIKHRLMILTRMAAYLQQHALTWELVALRLNKTVGSWVWRGKRTDSITHMRELYHSLHSPVHAGAAGHWHTPAPTCVRAVHAPEHQRGLCHGACSHVVAGVPAPAAPDGSSTR
jgi:hypothetical protein